MPFTIAGEMVWGRISYIMRPSRGINARERCLIHHPAENRYVQKDIPEYIRYCVIQT